MKAAAAFAAVGVALAFAFPSSPGTGDRPGRLAVDRPGRPDGMLVLALLSPERAMVANPRTGATFARELPGGTLCHGPLLAAGKRVVVFGLRGRRLVPRALPLGGDGRAVSLGRADTIVKSATPGRLWLGRWTRTGTRTGRVALREVDGAGRVHARTSRLVPRWSTIDGVVDGGLLITGGRGLVLRRPGGARLLFRAGWPLAAAGDRFAWARDGSRRLELWIDGDERSFDPPAGWRPDVTGGAAFSPDGRRLALIVKTRGRSRAAVIDVDSGAWRLVPGGRVAGYMPVAWSPSGGWLYLGRGKRVLAARGGAGRAVRLPIRTGGRVISIASRPGSAGR